MADIKKVYADAAKTTQLYPVTHEKAVIDNNGTTLESKFGALTDLVNQKQMEVGSVPSDLAPTKSSTNWVTSGGIFDALNSVHEGETTLDILTIIDYGLFIKTGLYNTGSAYAGSQDRSIMLLPPVEGLKSVVISSSVEYMLHFLSNVSETVVTPSSSTTFTYISGTAYMTGENVVSVPSNATRVDIQFKTNNMNTLLSALSVLKCVYSAETKILNTHDVVDNLYDGGSEKVLSAEQGKKLEIEARNIDIITAAPKATFADFSTTGATDSSIIKITLDASTNTIKFDASGAKTTQRYAWVELPSSLVDGKVYKIVADCVAQKDSGCDGLVALASATSSSGYTDFGFNVADGRSRIVYSFRKTASLKYLMLASNSLGNRFRYLYLSNIAFYEGYDNLPTLTKKVNDLEGPFDGITNIGTYSGQRIPSLSSWKIGSKKLMSTPSGSSQAGTSFGDWYFYFNDTHSKMFVCNLETMTFHSEVSMASAANDHCNACVFGNIFYDSNDQFPLIYTSGSRTDSYNHIQVWRIQYVNDTFSISKVQEITLPTGVAGNIWFWGQAYLDNDEKRLYYVTNIGSRTHFNVFAIPAIFDGGGNVISEVTLSESDRIDYFTSEGLRNQQGGVIHKGILYVFDGVPSWGTLTKLYVFDVWGKGLVNIVDIYNTLGIHDEFEGAGIWNGALISHVIGTNAIHAIYF